jgi:MurNAc alpha-1-phosphate uridylyltransferase
MNITVSPPIRRAMILAAGLGTRFKPWTEKHPKALAPVNGKSLLQRNIEYLQRYGVNEVVVNVHHFADQVISALETNKGWGSRVMISDETNEVLETGGGLKKARVLLEDAPFVLMNVDILTDMDMASMMAAHARFRPLATLAVTGRSTSRYFLFNGDEELCGWRNVQTGQERIARPESAARGGGEAHGGGLVQKAFSGIHIIDPAIFPLIGLEGKFSMVDLYLDLAPSQIIRGFDHSQSRLIDVGKPASAEEAARLFPL